MFINLTRVVNGRLRYYNLSLQKNLFNEYILTKTYGAIKNKKPTRKIREYFYDLNIANQQLNKILNEKLKKGYKYA